MRGWRRMNRWQRAGMGVAATVQLGLAALAGADLARRRPEQVRGPKWRWALLIGVNYVGPLAYLRWGRIAASPPGARGGKTGPASPATS
ncbi:MAG: PLDc N-terminal domain-containing protein [Candidatus Dormibacteria bacterium]|jgi:hypothetical protein